MKINTLHILTDENISPRVVAFFRQKGFDVLDTKEQRWYGKDDETLLEIAYSDKRFLLTHDSDFGTLAINKGKRFYGIIYLRLKNLKPSNVIKICNQLLQLNSEIFPGTLIVVEEARIRIRQIGMN